MEDKERRGTDLDEILKEFTSKPKQPKQADFSEQTRRMDPQDPQKPHNVSGTASEQTRRISQEDFLRELWSSEDFSQQTRRINRQDTANAQNSKPDWAEQTRRMDTTQFQPAPPEHTIRFDDLRTEIAGLIQGEDIAETAKIWNPGETVRADPFSDRWEPEYEQPMGVYTPPQPIQFQPRSKIMELKRKLVAGPEKRFYELSEIGVGKLQAAIFLSLLVALISAASTIMYYRGMVQPDRMRLMVFSQFLSLLVSGLLGSYQMLEGIGDLGRKRFTPNTLLTVTFIVCCLDGILCLRQVRVPCCAAFSLEVTMSLWGAYQRRSTQLSRLDTLRKASRLDGIAASAGDDKVLLRTEGQVEDFMDNYNTPSAPEKALNIYTLCAMLAALGIGATAYLLKAPQVGSTMAISGGLQVSAVCLLAALPASIFISQNRPAWILERRLHRLGTVLCGWKGIVGLCGKASFPITGRDLYPAEELRLNGMKFFGNREPEQIISYTAAMVTTGDCGIKTLFNKLLDDYSGRHYEAQQIYYYESGGMSATVQGETVHVGSWAFIKEQKIDAPDSARIGFGLYVAINHELCGVYAINYGKNPATAAGLRTLTSYKNLDCVLVSDDFMVTHGFLKARYGVKNQRLKIPDYDDKVQLRQTPLPENATTLVMSTAKGLAPLAYGVTGARVLRNASWLGAILHIIGGVVGLGIMLTLVLLGTLELITPVNMFLFQLIWLVPALLITEWTRSI